MPVTGLLQAAGFDPADTINCIPPDQCVSVPDDLVDMLYPALAAERRAVSAALEGKTGADAKRDRLICARETGNAIHELGRILLSRAAARQRDANNKILWESESIYKHYQRKNPVFQLNVFRTD